MSCHSAIFPVTHYDASFAFDAISAVAEARKHTPDLILLDLSLPAGDALVVVQHLRQFPSLIQTPIIVMGEREHRLSAGQVFQAGAQAFLPKPVHRQRLLSLVAKLLPLSGRPYTEHEPYSMYSHP